MGGGGGGDYVMICRTARGHCKVYSAAETGLLLPFTEPFVSKYLHEARQQLKVSA